MWGWLCLLREGGRALCDINFHQTLLAGPGGNSIKFNYIFSPPFPIILGRPLQMQFSPHCHKYYFQSLSFVKLLTPLKDLLLQSPVHWKSYLGTLRERERKQFEEHESNLNKLCSPDAKREGEKVSSFEICHWFMCRRVSRMDREWMFFKITLSRSRNLHFFSHSIRIYQLWGSTADIICWLSWQMRSVRSVCGDGGSHIFEDEWMRRWWLVGRKFHVGEFVRSTQTFLNGILKFLSSCSASDVPWTRRYYSHSNIFLVSLQTHIRFVAEDRPRR